MRNPKNLVHLAIRTDAFSRICCREHFQAKYRNLRPLKGKEWHALCPTQANRRTSRAVHVEWRRQVCRPQAVTLDFQWFGKPWECNHPASPRYALRRCSLRFRSSTTVDGDRIELNYTKLPGKFHGFQLTPSISAANSTGISPIELLSSNFSSTTYADITANVRMANVKKFIIFQFESSAALPHNWAFFIAKIEFILENWNYKSKNEIVVW